ncbi:MAG TPA: biopolymer transporter ExbD [Thermoanaerobaculia bacterium]|nr:biopolymer transporter ExbD [Thermoanaerobaculia bacterium]
MAMNVSGGSSGPKGDINITPLVDVVLVLLIIFMVVTPLLQMGYEVQVPPKVESAAPPPDMSDQIVVRMDASGNKYINKQMIPSAEFPTKLGEVLRGRQSKVVFFAADGELDYGKVSGFMDEVRNNGVENLGIVFDDIRPATATAAAATAP